MVTECLLQCQAGTFTEYSTLLGGRHYYYYCHFTYNNAEIVRRFFYKVSKWQTPLPIILNKERLQGKSFFLSFLTRLRYIP